MNSCDSSQRSVPVKGQLIGGARAPLCRALVDTYGSHPNPSGVERSSVSGVVEPLVDPIADNTNSTVGHLWWLNDPLSGAFSVQHPDLLALSSTTLKIGETHRLASQQTERLSRRWEATTARSERAVALSGQTSAGTEYDLG